MTRALALAIALSLCTTTHARSRTPVRHFMATVPCPATGTISDRCPGYVVDHIMPLCAGGADSPVNMQWQPLALSFEKDRDELALCRWLRAAGK